MSDQTENTSTDLTAEVSAASDGVRTLFVADFNDTETAWEAYEALRAIENGRNLSIDGAVVVKREADGTLDIQKATDHSTRRGLSWGLVGGAALGVLFPPSLIGSAVALGAGGAALGKVRQRHRRGELEKELEYAVAAGHSGILALVSDPGALEIRKALAKANGIVESAVDDVVAKGIKALAKNADQGGASRVEADCWFATHPDGTGACRSSGSPSEVLESDIRSSCLAGSDPARLAGAMTGVLDTAASPSHELEIDPGWRAAHTHLADRPEITDWTWAGLTR